MSLDELSGVYRRDGGFVYTGDLTREISFPLGGIGSGAIGLSGNGRLVDWEIFNRPNKNSTNGFSFFAIKAECEGEVILAKVLSGDLQPPFVGQGSERFTGFGFGVNRETLAGLPHFKTTTFEAEFPFARVRFEDPNVPLGVTLTAYNPFIPLNDKDSSLPIACFEYEVTNGTDHELNVSIVGNLTNPHPGAVNEYKSLMNVDGVEVRGIHLSSTEIAKDSPSYGDMMISTNSSDVSYQNYWYRGGWFDNLTVFWKEFTRTGRFNERNYTGKRANDGVSTYNRRDVCLLANHGRLRPGETKTFRFVISWNFPNFENYWNPGECCTPTGSSLAEQKISEATGNVCNFPIWKNYYATLFEDSTDSAMYFWNEYKRLYAETKQFTDALYSSTVPDSVLDAVASNLAVLKSPTCIRLTDGTLYGFEGCHADAGCCEGSCTHVWNYEQATAFLFPALARSMRNIDYKSTLFDNGKMAFRMMLPTEREKSNFHAAADGQMGGVIKVYREWKVSGDKEWLASIWPKVKKSLYYAWEPTNEDAWDGDKDGVMEGVQHHTLDVEIYGPNTYITSLYHAALCAATDIATELGDETLASELQQIYRKGRNWVDEHLFNGEYFHQSIDLADSRFPVDPELGEIKYQIGDGCHIDQVLGQWHAHVVGLGYIMDPTKVKSALSAIYQYNFIRCMREYPNACRIYSLNDEAGLLICTWPRGNSPKVPIPYADETMNGFEYQAACHMIYEGLVDEGIEVVKAIRDRYDGRRRNPWNEIECGSNYARSMASYGLLLALSGFEYHAARGEIGFSPKIHPERFKTFWSLDSGWGIFHHDNGNIKLSVIHGSLRLSVLKSCLFKEMQIESVRIGASQLDFEQSDGEVTLASAINIMQGDVLALSSFEV